MNSPISIRTLSAAFLLLGSPALANAAAWEGVFAGTLGKSKIIVELNAGPEKSEYKGGYGEGSRYSYEKQVFDLSLVPAENSIPGENEKRLSFIELNDIPRMYDEIEQGDPRLTGQWNIEVDAKGARGTWMSPDGKKTLPISLTRLDLVTDPDRPDVRSRLSATFMQQWLGSVSFADAGISERFNTIEVRYEQDSAFGARHPTLATFPDKNRMADINAMLHQQFLSHTADFRDCRNGLQLNWRTDEEEMSSSVERKVKFASASLLSVEHSGSMFCGGAHANNFIVIMTYDLTTLQQIGSTQESDLAKENFGRIFKLADKTERTAFERFALGRWNAAAAKAGEDGKSCQESGFIYDNPEGERNFSLSFVTNGLAVHRNDYPHVASVCLWQDFNPTIIPWADLKPWLRPDQTLLSIP